MGPRIDQNHMRSQILTTPAQIPRWPPPLPIPLGTASTSNQELHLFSEEKSLFWDLSNWGNRPTKLGLGTQREISLCRSQRNQLSPTCTATSGLLWNRGKVVQKKGSQLSPWFQQCPFLQPPAELPFSPPPPPLSLALDQEEEET